MPLYDYACSTCGREFEVTHSMKETPVVRCPECDGRDCRKIITSVPAVRLPDMSWEYENDGRGRRISQLATSLDDPNAYCRSRQEAKEKARRKGLHVEDD